MAESIKSRKKSKKDKKKSKKSKKKKRHRDSSSESEAESIGQLLANIKSAKKARSSSEEDYNDGEYRKVDSELESSHSPPVLPPRSKKEAERKAAKLAAQLEADKLREEILKLKKDAKLQEAKIRLQLLEERRKRQKGYRSDSHESSERDISPSPPARKPPLGNKYGAARNVITNMPGYERTKTTAIADLDKPAIPSLLGNKKTSTLSELSQQDKRDLLDKLNSITSEKVSGIKLPFGLTLDDLKEIKKLKEKSVLKKSESKESLLSDGDDASELSDAKSEEESPPPPNRRGRKTPTFNRKIPDHVVTTPWSRPLKVDKAKNDAEMAKKQLEAEAAETKQKLEAEAAATRQKLEKEAAKTKAKLEKEREKLQQKLEKEQAEMRQKLEDAEKLAHQTLKKEKKQAEKERKALEKLEKHDKKEKDKMMKKIEKLLSAQVMMQKQQEESIKV